MQTCATQLGLLGASVDRTCHGQDALTLRRHGCDADQFACSLPWYPGCAAGDLDTRTGELLVQAVSGLAAVHGRSRGAPTPIGLEVCSVAAGMLAGAGLLAASIAAHRGLRVRQAETSVLAAALCFLRHHLAIATCAEGLPAELVRAGCAPPFTTADGHLVELDVVSHDGWRDFWQRLGADRRDVARGWVPFAYRYNVAACALPGGLCEVVRRRTLAEVEAAASEHAGVRRLRGCAEVAADPALQDEAVRVPWTVTADAGPGSSMLAAALPPADLPLAGLRVVEVTSRIQGPLAGQLLRLLGADVVRVEPPGGDPARLVPPLAGSDGATFVAYNAGKRTVEIDYKQPAGRAALLELLAGADVFLQNWPAGRAEKLGLDHSVLARSNAGLVCCEAGGWPQSPGARPALGTDVLVQAHMAFGEGMVPRGEPPRTSMVTIVDVLGGITACQGALAGLHLRAVSGRGARVGTSLLSAAAAARRHAPEAQRGRSLPAELVRADLARLATDPDVVPLLEPGPGGTHLPASPWQFTGGTQRT